MKHIRWLFVCLACCTVLAVDKVQAADKVRTWTDVQGRTMQAEFIREVDGDVAFLKDGKLITFPLDRLSEADQKTIRELEANKVVPDEAKPAGATPNFVDPTARPETPPAGDSPEGSKEAEAANRVWTDRLSNKFTAKFVRVHAGYVVLLRGARTMTIGFDMLSAGDQAYVREVLTARGEANLIPPAAADNQNLQQRPGGAIPFDSPPQTAGEPRTGDEPPIGEREQNQAGSASTPSQDTAQNDQQPAEQVQPGGASPAPETRTFRRRRLKFENAQQVVAYLGALPIVAAIGSLIFALILRAATYWTSGAHLPYGEAYGTSFLLYLANGILGFAFAILTANVPDATADTLSFVMLPIVFLTQSAIIASRMETTFGEACLLTFVVYLTVFAIIVILIVIFLAVAIGLGGLS